MPAVTPGAGEPPRPPDRTPAIPDEVWNRFLTDSEERIRVSAPREPSARERLVPRRPPPARRSADGRRRFARAWRYGRPVLLMLVIAALALLTFYPSAALSWAEGMLGGPAVSRSCVPAHRDARCRSGELPRNSGFRDSPGGGDASQASLS